MTGAEGIDLKFIRQVHILEPWYNMSRNDQIIGRAVRQLSHKLLPFDKRNVQIFMYGMVLDNPEVESADLYLYRDAEEKAIQIGQISRVLKENAVDCILNHEQTLFTQQKINVEVDQTLSVTQKVIKFAVGDVDNSSMCDYMKCEYDCNSDFEKGQEINMDTYNINFITINTNKILDKIKRLMREQFFYKKENLIDKINDEVIFSNIQIFSALNKLIDDEAEFIKDKYDRRGHLINIDDYYLFQPEELKNPNISVFDRTVPIDYKRKMIQLKFTEKRKNPVDQDDDDDAAAVIVADNEINLKLSDDENISFDFVFDRLNKIGIQITEEEKNRLVIHYKIDRLNFQDKKKLIMMCRTGKEKDKNVLEYFSLKFVDVKKKNIFMLLNDENKEIFFTDFNENKNKDVDFDDSMRTKYDVVNFPQRKVNDKEKLREKFQTKFGSLIGFLWYKKGKISSDSVIFFKHKDNKDLFSSKTGKTCSDTSKLNEIITPITQLTTILGAKGNIGSKDTKAEGGSKKDKFDQTKLCLALELLFRLCEMRKTNGLIWFLAPELANYFEII
jgi:hypothetical protein